MRRRGRKVYKSDRNRQDSKREKEGARERAIFRIKEKQRSKGDMEEEQEKKEEEEEEEDEQKQFPG